MKRLLAIVATLSCAAAHAQIRVETDPDTTTLHIVGQWADACAPVLDQALLEDGDIVLLASRDAEKGCSPGKTEFDFDVSIDSIFADESAAGDYPVRFYVRDNQSRAATLAGFDIVQIGERPQVTPENGLWWAEPGGQYETSGPGVGFSIEVQGEQSVMMLNGYAPDGQAQWLLSTGSLKHGLLRGNLTELADGQAFFGPFTRPQTVLTHGRVLVQFHDQARATLWLLGEVDGRFQIQPISLIRFAFGVDPPLAGRWLLVPQAGGKAQPLDLTVVESGANETVLGDVTGIATVTCQRPNSSAPAMGCVLRGEHRIQFNDIGLGRWRGHDDTGAEWLAVRID